MNIWIVQASFGEYDNFWATNIKAFTSQEAAQAWVDAQSPVDYKALDELEELSYQYTSTLNYSQCEHSKEWDLYDKQYDKQYDALQQQAKDEIQSKYPEADLDVDRNFNGYRVNEQPIELEVDSGESF